MTSPLLYSISFLPLLPLLFLTPPVSPLSSPPASSLPLPYLLFSSPHPSLSFSLLLPLSFLSFPPFPLPLPSNPSMYFSHLFHISPTLDIPGAWHTKVIKQCDIGIELENSLEAVHLYHRPLRSLPYLFGLIIIFF